MAVFTRACFLLILNLLSGPHISVQALPLLQKKSARFGRELFSETFSFVVNTLLDLTANIGHNHVDFVTVRVRIRRVHGLKLKHKTL